MPAYKERLTICPREDGQPISIRDFPLWWDRRAFFNKYGKRRIDSGNPFYVDYYLLLSGAEARAWDKRCREADAENGRNQEAHMIEPMRQVESLLSNAGWVIIESYEWESGLD